MKKIKRVCAILLTALMVVLVGATTTNASALVEGYPLTPEEVQEPSTLSDPSGRVTFTLTPIADGTGHGSSEHCIIREENGFSLGDETAQDGVVCNYDRVTYKLSYNVKSSDTPTTFNLRFESEIQNKAGEKLDTSAPANVNTNEFLPMCQGGTGLVHTGVMNVSTCNMTFPATSATSSSDLGTFTVHLNNSVTDGYLDTKMVIGTTKSDSIPNRTRIVGASAADVTLTKTNPVLETIDGVSYYAFKHYIRAIAPNTTKGLMRFGSTVANFSGTGTVTIDNLPEGTQIDTSHPNMSVEGNVVSFEDLSLSPTQVPGNYNGIGTGGLADTNIHSISYRIPLGSLETDANHKITAHISDLTYTKEKSISNQDDLLYPHPWLGDSSYTPGLKKPSDYLTGTGGADPLYRYSVKGTNGHLNNDWADVNVKKESIGAWFKELYKNADGKPDETASAEGTSANTTSLKFYNDTYWVKAGMNPFAGEINNAVYCDVWDDKFQKIDTRYEPYAEEWNKTTQQYEQTNARIEYGVSTRDPLPIHGAANATNNQIADCGDAGQTTWSDSPSENTNMFRVSFEGSTPADQAPSADEGRRGSVQAVYVPFTSSDEENFPLSPQPTAVRDTLMFSHNGSYVTQRDNATTFFQGSRAEAPAPRLEGTHNSGTRQGLVHNNNPNITRVNLNETVEWTPEFEVEIGSHFSNIEFNSVNGKYELVELVPADFGADGLPGTGDDVSDWKIRFKESNPRITAYNSGVDGFTRWISTASSPIIGTLPGYIQDGTKIPVTSRANADELPGDDPNNNVYQTFITAVAKDSVSQDKWAKSHVEQSGKDVSWGIAWSNTSATSHGDVTLYDVLPYNGDKNGTNLANPLSNIRFDFKQVDDDVSIHVSSDAPADTADFEWVELDRDTGEPKEAVDGEITAIKIIDPEIEAGDIQLLEVTASTDGAGNGDLLKNNLLSGTVDSLTLPLPATDPVTTSLYDTSIEGSVFFDSNSNGVKNEEETGQLKGVVIELKDAEGNVVETTVSDDEGKYGFHGIEVGDYTISILERGDLVKEDWNNTTPTEQSVKITQSSPISDGNNFGFWGEVSAPSFDVVKKVKGYEGDLFADGDTATFVFSITNTGDMPLGDIKFKDNVYGEVKCQTEVPTLFPGETFDCEIQEEVVPTHSKDGSGLERTFTDPIASKIGYNSESTNYYTGAKLCSKDFCPIGQTISDLEFTENGSLVAGYGDWGSNVDSFGTERVSLTEISPYTGRAMRSSVPTGAEAIDMIRKIDGKLYAPTTDPSDKAAYGETGGNRAGALTNKGDDWGLLKTNVNMVHTFDVVKHGDTYYMSGSTSPDGRTSYATIMSGKEGETFTPLFSIPYGSAARVYNLLLIGDKLYYSLGSVGADSGIYERDLITGATERVSTIAAYGQGNDLFEFNGQPAHYQEFQIIPETGRQGNVVRNLATGQLIAILPAAASDFYTADDGEVYTIAGNGVYRLEADSLTPTKVADLPAYYGSLAVRNGEAYIGKSFGQINVVPLNGN